MTKSRPSVVGTLGFIMAVALAAGQNSAQARVIYGDDNRLDLHQVKDANLLRLAESTVALIKKYKLTPEDNGLFSKLETSVYGEEMRLCKEEPFWDQQTAAFCSGSMVGEDLMLTAGHCIEDQADCDQTDFVFGWAYFSKWGFSNQLPADNVYGCKEIVGRVLDGAGADYAVIRVDRKVKGRKPLEINRTKEIPLGTPLVVIGHPSGLRTKVAGGAVVRSNDQAGYFVANLDTYGGNSGSAVFNAVTGKIEGVLVRGEQDFEYDAVKGCYQSKKCESEACRGEDVTKIAAAQDLIPELPTVVAPVPPVIGEQPAPQPMGELFLSRGGAYIYFTN